MAKAAELRVKFDQYKYESTVRLTKLEAEVATMRWEIKQHREDSIRWQEDMKKLFAEFTGNIQSSKGTESSKNCFSGFLPYEDIVLDMPDQQLETSVGEEEKNSEEDANYSGTKGFDIGSGSNKINSHYEDLRRDPSRSEFDDEVARQGKEQGTNFMANGAADHYLLKLSIYGDNGYRWMYRTERFVQVSGIEAREELQASELCLDEHGLSWYWWRCWRFWFQGHHVKGLSHDSSGIFWDNDSLAALLAPELKADLLVLLSDVDGLYSGPPSDPQSKLIYTYIKEELENTITFGDKSRLGRGGMTAKVKAAVYASQVGIPVVITSGFAGDNIIKVLRGQHIGTLFHRDAHTWIPSGELNVREMAVTARESSRHLQAMPAEERSKILLAIADALEANEKMILHENEADVEFAQEDGYESSLVSRLAQKPGKVSTLAKAIRVLAKMEEPIGQVLKRTELSDGFI